MEQPSGKRLRKDCPIVTFHDLYRSLGDTDAKRAHAYRALFNVALTSVDIELVRETTNKNWALGNDRFRREIEGLVGRRTAPARRGPAAAPRDQA